MIKIENLSFGYGKKPLIENLSLEIAQGGVVALIGPNGAGKSTLLRLIARLLQPGAGRVLLQGKDVHHTPSDTLARMMSILPQSSNIAPRLTIRELVGFGRYPYHKGRVGEEDRAIVEQSIAQFGLGDMADRLLESLSGGQQQRALVAMNYAQQTPYMLLDEPLNNLDIASSRALTCTLRDLASQQGKTVVIVLHDLNVACGYADRIVAMKDGALASYGPPDEVITDAFIRDVFNTDARVATLDGRPMVVL